MILLPAAWLLSVAAGPAAPVLDALRSDLSPELAAAAAAATTTEDPVREVLSRIAEADPGYHFVFGPVTIDTDRRWFATVPEDASGAPLLELRRWPGDSVLALYPVPPGAVPAAPDLSWEAPKEDGSRLGVLAGARGRWRARWAVREVPAAPAAIGILLLAGDGGLGEEGGTGRLLELEYAAAAVQVDAEIWRNVPPLPAGRIDLPRLPPVPPQADERKHGWQVVEAGAGTLALPPGVLARRTDLGVPAPRPIAGGVLWLRGRFTDREGQEVVLGDPARAGYVAEVRRPPRGWAAGRTPPVGLPGGTLANVEPFTLAADRSRAAEATAGRWTEPGFAGAWIVFRLQASDGGVEIGLPVLRGRTSPALFWIPVTYRPPGMAAAPPPVDPSDRLGIRFEPPLPAEARRDLALEGRITGPGFRGELPKGWWPRATLQASDGFPIEFVDAKGKVWGALQRQAPGEADPGEAEGWTPARRPAAWGAVAAWTRADGAVALRGSDGTLWRLTPVTGADAGKWGRLSNRFALLAPPRRQGAATGAAPRRGD